MSRNFSIEFSDLAYDKQQSMIDDVQSDLIERYKEEGQEFLKKERNEPKPGTWQEAFCREYTIDWRLWGTEEEQKTFDWETSVITYAEEEAEKKCFKSMHHNSVEIEI